LLAAFQEELDALTCSRHLQFTVNIWNPEVPINEVLLLKAVKIHRRKPSHIWILESTSNQLWSIWTKTACTSSLFCMEYSSSPNIACSKICWNIHTRVYIGIHGPDLFFNLKATQLKLPWYWLLFEGWRLKNDR
jgi:hypothetical protein